MCGAFRVVRQLAEDVAGEVRRRGQLFQLHVHDLRDFFFQLEVGRQDANHRRHELARGALEDRFGQALLRPEVVVQQRGVHARFFRDFLRARARRTRPGEDAVRRVENPLFGVAVP